MKEKDGRILQLSIPKSRVPTAVLGSTLPVELWTKKSAARFRAPRSVSSSSSRESIILQSIAHSNYSKAPHGPALVFRRDPDSKRLDHWLADHGNGLDLFDRIGLVRQLGEALRHAHRQGLYHRALAPKLCLSLRT